MSSLLPPSKPSLRILWVGPLIAERYFDNPAVSAAASIWQLGLIRSVLGQLSPQSSEAGIEIDYEPSNVFIELISHLPCQSFPKGVLWPRSDASLFPQGFKGYGVGYCNLVWLRDWILRWQYSRKIGKVLITNAHNPFDLVVSYNAEVYVSAPVANWARKMSLPWISIIADLPKHYPQTFLINAKVAQADGRLFLSWKNFQDFARPDHDLFLEGGVHLPEASRSTSSKLKSFLNSGSKVKRIAYFGGLTTLGGMDLFLQATCHLPGPQYEFHIIGVGDTLAVSRVQSFAKADCRIHYHGPASEKALHELGSMMDIFVDPRPKALSENNFPSKILTYLQFTRPIISTMGHGIPTEYHQVLIHLEQEDPAVLSQLIQSVCGWDEMRTTQYQSTMNEFILNAKSWRAQGKRALDWMQSIVQKKHST
ncbi:MAG: glycosyltransferase [Polynucleobacter sp.]|nr:glycosyltransferase [Polynucleobacter sp.]